jgi:CspA family cold shock protein
MSTGRVRWFDPRKGFGFIIPDGDVPAADVFVHISAVERAGLTALFDGQIVHYEVASTGDGILSAQGVSPAEMEVLAGDEFVLDEAPLPEPVVQKIQICTNFMIEQLQRHPEELYRIHPGAFEDLVAKIFEDEGFTVEMNRAWNQADGGVDIIAVRTVGIVPIRVAIQCKRYSRENRVTAERIRALAGVLDRFKAHVGVLATTSFFTKHAEDEMRNHLWQVTPRDYDDIVSSLMRLKRE